MAKIFRLGDYRRSKARVTFQRAELAQILAVYSRRVASGEWRDYAIDHERGMAVFSVFRHAAERPMFLIIKLPPGHDRRGDYLVTSGPRKLRQGSLTDVLGELDRRPRPVV